ncbi:hypothetical protein Scep_004569 [Stephania cephalantha]|uniref:Uncharacterized protein n=1 Tax=Stephania cephalantha TaxID=152367 RepID=A0AAP0KV66_9MAGN
MPIGASQIEKEFQLPVEAIDYYLVAKYTSAAAAGKFGIPVYTVSDDLVQDAEILNVRWTSKNKKRGKNMNKKVANLKQGERLKIDFLLKRGVGDNQRYRSRYLGKIVRDPYMCPIRVLQWDNISEVSKNHIWDVAKGGKDGNLPNIDQVFFETRKKGGILVEPEDINKHVE